jgi:hypothetical protein
VKNLFKIVGYTVTVALWVIACQCGGMGVCLKQCLGSKDAEGINE